MESLSRGNVAPLALRIDLFVVPAVDAVRFGLAFMHLELEGEFGHWIGAAKEMQHIRSAWEKLRNAPSRAGRVSPNEMLGVVEEVEATLAACEDAVESRQARRVTDAARRGKAVAAALERLFA